jgi:thioredoxin-related protein
LAINSRTVACFSRVAFIGVMFITLTLSSARAAQLVMFEQAGCPWCKAFDRQIGPIYDKTEDGLRAPLRRVDIERPLPPDLAFIQVERLTPLFVLVDKGHEIGRIRGYGGPEMFWTQLYMLMQKLDAAGTGGERAQGIEKTLRANG